jgi:hypothetical protein
LRRDGRRKGLVVADPKYLPPILRPSKILALALNFREDIGSVTPAVRRKPACDGAGKLYGVL